MVKSFLTLHRHRRIWHWSHWRIQQLILQEFSTTRVYQKNWQRCELWVQYWSVYRWMLCSVWIYKRKNIHSWLLSAAWRRRCYSLSVLSQVLRGRQELAPQHNKENRQEMSYSVLECTTDFVFFSDWKLPSAEPQKHPFGSSIITHVCVSNRLLHENHRFFFLLHLIMIYTDYRPSVRSFCFRSFY